MVDVEGGEVLPEHNGVFLVSACGLKEKGIGIPVVLSIIDEAVLFFGTVSISGKLPEGGFGDIMVVALPSAGFSFCEIPIIY